MWARTKTHNIEESLSVRHSSSKDTKRGWKKNFEKDLEIHSEQGLYLKGLRLREGYTQAQLGGLIGVSPNNISAMERGRRHIGKDIAQRLSRLFKVKYQRFL